MIHCKRNADVKIILEKVCAIKAVPMLRMASRLGYPNLIQTIFKASKESLTEAEIQKCYKLTLTNNHPRAAYQFIKSILLIPPDPKPLLNTIFYRLSLTTPKLPPPNTTPSKPTNQILFSNRIFPNISQKDIKIFQLLTTIKLTPPKSPIHTIYRKLLALPQSKRTSTEVLRIMARYGTIDLHVEFANGPSLARLLFERFRGWGYRELGIMVKEHGLRAREKFGLGGYHLLGLAAFKGCCDGNDVVSEMGAKGWVNQMGPDGRCILAEFWRRSKVGLVFDLMEAGMDPFFREGRRGVCFVEFTKPKNPDDW
eukprot:CAMPEP_0115021194 /NCGR_PEP_ID=MMETSP0216-20121206/30719_1 /TAXON_ID=223996 /ORGANISM="Protocruzia adherens, Strain Boccale" /LENGTH=310 /DNA_ID=CAMNT_0002393459 /DNA_START=26 /DNA_END=955 /DNA_ORIENTATION=-